MILALVSGEPVRASSVFQVGKTRVSVELPAHWQAVRDLYGIPLMILGPWDGQDRAVLSVVPTNLKGIRFFAGDASEIEREFKIGREEWLGKYGGHSLQYFGYRSLKWPGFSEVHSVGFSYHVP